MRWKCRKKLIYIRWILSTTQNLKYKKCQIPLKLHRNQKLSLAEQIRTDPELKSSGAKGRFRTLDSSRPSEGRISPLTWTEEVKRTSGVCEAVHFRHTLTCVFTVDADRWDQQCKTKLNDNRDKHQTFANQITHCCNDSSSSQLWDLLLIY